MTTADRITQVCDDVKQMLLDKNAAYGDSASNPLRVFSKADKLEAIRVRIDDKLSRISRGQGYPGDNDVRDLVGYLLLYLANDGTEQDHDKSRESLPWWAGRAIEMDQMGIMWEDRGDDTLWHVGNDYEQIEHPSTRRVWSRAWIEATFGTLTPIEG